jgi:hypothetical protein
LLYSATEKALGTRERNCLDEVIKWFDEDRFSDEEFLTQDKKVKQGTKVIFSTTDTGGLSAEVISPGPWSLATCYTLGCIDNSDVSEAMFRIFLGRTPLSEECKLQVGENALYLATGGKLPRSRLENSIAFRHMNDWKRPGAPDYPEPEGLHIELTPDMFYLNGESPSNIDQPVSIKLLSDMKRENRRRVDRAISKSFSTASCNGTSLSGQVQFQVKFDTTLIEEIPRSIQKYSVEFMDIQSPYKYYNEPTSLACENGYEGYESRVVPIEFDEIYCPLEIPTLDQVEDELTCLEMPKNVDENPQGKMALILNYVQERSKKDPYYQGIFNVGDNEKLDVCEPPSNKGEKLLDSRWEITFLQWQKSQ